MADRGEAAGPVSQLAAFPGRGRGGTGHTGCRDLDGYPGGMEYPEWRVLGRDGAGIGKTRPCKANWPSLHLLSLKQPALIGRPMGGNALGRVSWLGQFFCHAISDSFDQGVLVRKLIGRVKFGKTVLANA